ncbi:sulfatase-like hydrolase/transferase [Haloferula sp.]|uniref:sulfatase-like hydrolase/transferase n=1 Tax=Haloferula sp. TaxID=2497595 RepID=UPI00329E19C4
MKTAFRSILSCCLLTPLSAQIVPDGEYKFLRAQHGEKWDAEDKEIDQKLAQIREKNGGKRPNILYVLIDDVSFGQMGNRKMNYVMGIETPRLNQLSEESLNLMRMYTEPSCTPTRAAFLTGRHPVRIGIKEVKVALVGEGLQTEEVTIAEVLKKSGYNTAHIGKWHQGDIEQAYPHNQGFDYASFPLHQQVQLTVMTKESGKANNQFGYTRDLRSSKLELDKKFRPFGLVTSVEAEAGGTASECDILKAGEEWSHDHYVKLNELYQKQILEQVDSLAKKDEPFFLQYWPLYPLNFVYEDSPESRNGGFFAEKLQLLDGWIGELLDKLEETGEADNTIVVFMADNGLMYHYEGPSGLSQLIYRGGKTQHLEGGVRVDAFIRWPGVVEANSYAGDITHVSDLFSTFARVGQATEHIPTDRVIDGIDQTALLLNGEEHGRRDFVYIYENEILRSVVKQEYKMHVPAPGVPGAAAPVFNVLRDPREENAHVGAALWSGASFQDMIKRHMMTIAQYPHSKLGKGKPYEGIDNLRPESKETVELFMSWHPKK